MERRTLVKAFSIGSLGLGMSGLGPLADAIAGQARREDRMPVLFVGHGSPMNAIIDNAFSRAWAEVGARLARPSAILCVSAHWETPGVMVTAMERPRTIHDFHGFPPELHQKLYPAPGSPETAARTAAAITSAPVGLDQRWGLDHGAWSVLSRMFPRADVPVLQLSLDRARGPAGHFALARELRPLRERGVLIVGSGNIVHNLGRLDRRLADAGFDWAIEFDARVTDLIDRGDHQGLVEYARLGRAARLSVPTDEHYLPLLYALAVRDEGEPVVYFNEALTMGGISMRSLIIG